MTQIKNKKPVAVFDLDDTLIDLKEELFTRLTDEYGKDNVPHWSLWDTYGIEHNVGISEKELMEFVLKNKLFRNIQPHLFSKALLVDLRNRGYHIIILTARNGFIPNAYSETKVYLDKHELYHDELIVSKHGKNKMDYLDHHDTIHFAIDDQEKNCIQFEESGKVDHVFLHALPHNRGCTQFIRLHNLYQLYPHIGLDF
jgi:hypothetical protein